MGCFLACFGYSKKRKHRKPSNKVLFGDQRHGSYQPLDSFVPIKLHITENPITSDSEFREKPKERSSFKIGKKVSFNLNVQAYEPIPTDKFLESDEEKNGEKKKEETAKARVSLSLTEEDSLALRRMGSYPSNYRYRNCRDSFDEEDEIVLDESNLDEDEDEDEDEDDDEDDDSNGEGNGDDQNTNPEEFSEQFYNLSMESQKRDSMAHLAEEKMDHLMPLHTSPSRELAPLASNQNARNRSQYVHSVLNPIENLTQWKAIKARATIPPLKHKKKENIALEQEQPQIPFSSKPSFNPSSFNFTPTFNQVKPLLQEVAVDASLSNWLDSSETTWVSKSSTIPVATMSSKKNIWEYRSNSSINTEDKTGLRGH